MYIAMYDRMKFPHFPHGFPQFWWELEQFVCGKYAFAPTCEKNNPKFYQIRALPVEKSNMHFSMYIIHYFIHFWMNIQILFVRFSQKIQNAALPELALALSVKVALFPARNS